MDELNAGPKKGDCWQTQEIGRFNQGMDELSPLTVVLVVVLVLVLVLVLILVLGVL